MIAHILSLLFPPKLPSPIQNWEERTENTFEEQGCAGTAKRKRYRNGIERHFAENSPVWRIDRNQYQQQLIRAEAGIDVFERELIAQGYTNTIHDCWEKLENS